MALWLPLIGFIALFLFIYALIDAYPKLKLDIPSPPSLPIIGHLHHVIGVNTEDQLKLAQEGFFNEKTKLTKIWFLNIMAIAPGTPEMFQRILTADECMEKPFIAYRLLALNNGLLASRFHQWQRDRKFFNNSFKLSTLQSFLPIFNDAAIRIVDDIGGNKGTFNISPYIFKCTLKMICSTSLGMKINDVENNETFDKIYHAVNYVIESVATLQNKPVIYPETLYLLTPRAWKHIASAWFLRNFHYRIMNERREVLNNDDGSNVKEDENLPFYDIFVDQILKNKGLFTDRQIWEHILTILAAGYETSATCLSHAMLFLAIFEDVQNKVYEEIEEVFPTSETEITVENLGKLQYMERVIKETLRVAPVGPVVFRETRKDFEIEPGLVIPKGVVFILHIYGLHRSKFFWGERANEFDPDNFLPERLAERHPAAFIPFSFGKRNCIGARYAMLSMKIILLRLLQNFKFTTHLKYEELRFKSTLTLQLIGEHLVQIEKRQKEKIE